MTTETNPKYSLPNLSSKLKDGSNYPEWAAEIETYMEIYGLDEIINGNIKIPTKAPAADISTTITNDPAKWKKANMRAKAFMLLNTECTATSMIIMKTNANTAWDKLKSQYEGKTRTNLQALTDTVFNLQFDGRIKTIDEHIDTFQTHWGHLSATVSGETNLNKSSGVLAAMTKCDALKAQRLSGTLQEHYKMIVNNIASQTEEPTYNNITIQLRDLITAPKKKSIKITDTEIPPTAFAGKQQMYSVIIAER
jgi:hypothetical protein